MLVVLACGRAPVRRRSAAATDGTASRSAARACCACGPIAVRRVELVGGAGQLTAVRTTSGWEVDGRPADEPTVEALDALVTTLAGLRALDAFRPGDRTALGLDPPAATLAVFTDRRERRLALGTPNAAGNGLYVERLGHPRVFVVGTGMLSAIDRVFYQQRLADKTAD